MDVTHTLFSFGYNAFNQTSLRSGEESVDIHKQNGVSNVILATWESTVVSSDDNGLEIWGWIPEANGIQGNRFQIWEDRKILKMFGPIESGWLGGLDDNGTVWYRYFGSEVVQKLATGAKDIGYCQSRREIYVLTETGLVDCYLEKDHGFGPANRLSKLPKVKAMAVSFSHVLFCTYGVYPIHVRGSNRYSQLGFDTTVQNVDDVTAVEYFCGLMPQESSVASSLFHSAVILDGSLYTFGWKKNGRLGWGSNSDGDVVGLAEFRGHNDELIEDVHIVKVACGANHTLALDDQGKVWSCGSSKYIWIGWMRRLLRDGLDQYKQLGRSTPDGIAGSTHDDVFRPCTRYSGYATDCHAGRWNSFIIVDPAKSA
ncbi:regulator of chromosome condensation 1/beta-lactamase-inhibitor protein II [Fennellomyces sp. T-0311]|nr:regulator of chromosome condensation 1/beta-lactamase-inhibitor protein II [Fennellomyces sp. T-0311]